MGNLHQVMKDSTTFDYIKDVSKNKINYEDVLFLYHLHSDETVYCQSIIQYTEYKYIGMGSNGSYVSYIFFFFNVFYLHWNSESNRNPIVKYVSDDILYCIHSLS